MARRLRRLPRRLASLLALRLRRRHVVIRQVPRRDPIRSAGDDSFQAKSLLNVIALWPLLGVVAWAKCIARMT
jgi:hypothetical protein